MRVIPTIKCSVKRHDGPLEHALVLSLRRCRRLALCPEHREYPQYLHRLEGRLFRRRQQCKPLRHALRLRHRRYGALCHLFRHRLLGRHMEHHRNLRRASHLSRRRPWLRNLQHLRKLPNLSPRLAPFCHPVSQLKLERSISPTDPLNCLGPISEF